MSEKKGKTFDKETGQQREVLVTDEELVEKAPAAVEPKQEEKQAE